MARTIESPGVEIREVDLDLRATLPVGTNVFVQGFTDSGPTDELVNVTSITEFEQIYGLPTNASERYMYHTSKQVLESNGNLLTNRLPYGLSGGGGYSSEYSALLFPVTVTASTNATLSSSTFDQGSAYEIGEPVQFVLTDAERLAWESGQITWTDTPNTTGMDINTFDDIGNAGIIVINEIKTSVNNNYGGYYLGVHDNTGLNDTTYDSISSISYNDNATVGDWSTVPSTMIETSLTGTDLNDSVSEDMETIPSTPIDGSEDDDVIVLGLFRLRQSTTTTNPGVALQAVRKEAFVGTMDATRIESPNGQPQSYFIGNQVNDDSVFMKVKINPNLSSQTSWTPGGVTKKIRSSIDKLYAIGPRVDPTDSSLKRIGSLPTKLSRSLRLAENKEQVPIDIVTDGGLSTIWASVAQPVTNDNNAGEYDDTTYLDGVFEDDGDATGYLADQDAGASSSVQNDWAVVYNRLSVFCGETRKDCLYIADALKHIFVQGELKTLQDSNKNFSSHVYWPLKNLFGASNSNYACTYANWVKVYDDVLGAHTWLPFSGFEAKIMANMDAALQPWYAPAGLNNGLITGISDIAVSPTQKQRDLIYRISVNPVVYFPGDGYTVWGQKTLQKKPSAFDRINVRRLFLVLEKATNAVMRYFVFQPNTVFTRTRVVNILSPIFEIAKTNEGVYDYLIVCDDRNNTSAVIDNNELVVDIYLKPVRTAEFILVNFYATRTSQDFTELI
jgi:phage tail sheath protein FI